MNDLAQMKRCPFCAEEIQAAAVRCKHCQANLAAGATGAHPLAPTAAKPSEAIGVAMLLLPLVSTALIWLWVGQMNLLQDPGTTLFAIAAVTVLLTAGLVAVESSQVRAGDAGDLDANGKRRTGPGAWFLASVLFWVVGFPGWLHARRNYGLANMVVGGLLVGAVFLGSCWLMQMSINENVARVQSTLRGLGR